MWFRSTGFHAKVYISCHACQQKHTIRLVFQGNETRRTLKFFPTPQVALFGDSVCSFPWVQWEKNFSMFGQTTKSAAPKCECGSWWCGTLFYRYIRTQDRNKEQVKWMMSKSIQHGRILISRVAGPSKVLESTVQQSSRSSLGFSVFSVMIPLRLKSIPNSNSTS